MSLCAFSGILLSGCTLNNVGNQKSEGIDVSNMDTTYKPGENFYMYAIGNWKKKNPIPAEFSIYGSFNQLDENNTRMLKDLFDELSKRTDLNEEQKKIMYFYNSGMDTVTIEKNGITPLKPYFEKINNLKNSSAIAGLLGNFHQQSLFSTFYLYAAQDEKNSNMVIAQLFQGGLGLPDRDYYLGDDDISKMLRSEYQKYITRILKLSHLYPEKDIETITQNILSFETRLAKASMKRVDMRDPQKLYHKMTVDELQKLTPNFTWKEYFTNVGKDNIQSLNVGQPDFFVEVNNMLKQVPLEQWKQYLTFHLLTETAPFLGKEYEKTHFDFYETVLSGKTKMKDRWKKIVETTSDMLGEAVGKLYVQKYFPEEYKTRMLELVKNLKSTFREHIKDLDWMTDETKQKAIEKLDAINLKIGYPDKWRDYSAVAVKDQSFILNVLAARQFEVDYILSQIDKPVDRQKWDMFPQTVNAYYSPNMNEIVFPAAILQPPFFNANADNAVNYGGIGTVIGHEMTHGFDDQGRQYDKNGNLNEWWNEKDASNFKAKTDKFIPMYESYLINDSLHVNGELTMGENIADMGGLSISLDALKKTLTGNEQPIDGFTPVQRFYLSFANVWRQNIRLQELQRRLKEDVHSPAEVRVNVPVYNFEDFINAFNIKPSDKHYIKPSDRLKIW